MSIDRGVVLNWFQDSTHTLAKVIALTTQDKESTRRFLVHALRDHGIKQATKPGFVPKSRVIIKSKIVVDADSNLRAPSAPG